MAKLVGILNLTPDSFSDGGRYDSTQQALAAATLMFEEGASWVDVGAESTRPGATPLTPQEEWARLEPVLGPLLEAHPDSISLDTRHHQTLSLAAAKFGKPIANDVGNFSEPKMIEVAASLGLTCVVSHIPDSAAGNVHSSHHRPKIDSIEQVAEEQLQRVEQMIAAGIPKENIILDPGFGFGKTPALNLRLVDYPRYVSDLPVFLGISRKSSLKLNPQTGEIYPDLQKLTKQGLNVWLDLRSADLALEAVKNGVEYLRVHNVALHSEFLAETS